ncbi:Probable metal-nicotianamine transporter YSL7 [Linum perenne]
MAGVQRRNRYADESGFNSDEILSEDVGEGEISVEEAFKDEEVPTWRQQLTVRSLFTCLVLSVVFNFIVCKLNLTTGVIPSLNAAAGLLGFAILKSYTSLLSKFGFLKQPFSRQENTVIQTCIVASSGIAFSSGTASYMLGMSPYIAGQEDEGNSSVNEKSLSIGWMIGFLFAVSFVGLFSIVPLRKQMILKYKLTYPSGTATAFLINSFHTPKGAALAKNQVTVLFKAFGGSFIWAFFQWFFAAGDDCGFVSFPTFGLQAYKQKSTYVGVGMICPYMVNISLLFGAVISWGIMWPLIEAKKGDWYSADLSPSSLHGIQGYRVFIAIATMLGDGLFQVLFLLIKTMYIAYVKIRDSKKDTYISSDSEPTSYDDKRRTEYFLRDQIPNWVAITGYVVLAAISIFTVPLIFPPLHYYHIIVAYLIAPILAFCNAYGCGLTDWSLASNYGKFAIIIFSSWIGLNNGGVLAGLASCGVMMSIVSTAADLMQDFKTGYLTLSSPRAMFFSQIFGTALGCIISPPVFWFFYKAYPIGKPDGPYPAPYGQLYRGIALLGVEGVSSLPRNCAYLSIGFFLMAMAINSVKEFLKAREYRVHKFIPSPMCMAIPFYLGAYFGIDMCVGSLIVFVWSLYNKKQAKEYSPAVASGMICGDSLWGIPAAILSMAGVGAPICMKFLSAGANKKVDALLAG